MSRRLEVLHVHSGNLFGGIESILVTLSQHQDARMGHTFALSFPGRLANELRESNARMLLTAPARFSRPWTLCKARARLREELNRSKFDIAICHSSWSRAVFGPVLRKKNLPFVMWQHSAGDRQHWIDRLSRRVPIELAINNSRFTARKQSLREPAVNTAVVYPPVAPPNTSDNSSTARREVRQELQVPDENSIILQVGRIEPGKGHMVLLDAAATLLDLPDWTIVLVGGAQRDEEHAYQLKLERVIHDLGLDGKVRFVGERDDVEKFFAAADIYCQPNVLPESFGITFVEALYAGVPVITTEIGAAPEIVNGECGILLPRENVAAVAGALRTLLSDEFCRVDLGKNGPDRATILCDPAAAVSNLHRALLEVAR